jgi:methylated-DNA-protein-cysteine methyltransferase-like protein
MTYGSIARSLIPPQGMGLHAYFKVGPRWVGYAVARCPDDVPWHRVVNAKGEISRREGFGPDLQQKLLMQEGVKFSPVDRIKLKRYLWQLE